MISTAKPIYSLLALLGAGAAASAKAQAQQTPPHLGLSPRGEGAFNQPIVVTQKKGFQSGPNTKAGKLQAMGLVDPTLANTIGYLRGEDVYSDFSGHMNAGKK